MQFRGLEGITGVYVGKIAPGASTQPERHLYEKVIYILQGEGVAEIQQRDRVPQNIQWRAGQLVFSADEHVASSDELQCMSRRCSWR